MAPLPLGQAPEPPVVASPCPGRIGLLETPAHPWALRKATLSPPGVCFPSLPQGGQGLRLGCPRAEAPRA